MEKSFFDDVRDTLQIVSDKMNIITDKMNIITDRMNTVSDRLDKVSLKLNEVSEIQRESAKQIEENRKLAKESWVLVKETEKQMRKTDERLDRVAKRLGNMGDINGEIAEEFFYTSLKESPRLGEISFDQVFRNMRPLGDRGPEFDVVLLNGDSVGLIETKRKAHVDEVHDLTITKIESFRKAYPDFGRLKLYFGIATLVTNQDLIGVAQKEGIFLLTQKGEHIEFLNGKAKIF